MEPDFWQKRWALNQIGFHLPQVNPHLQQFWSGLGLAPGTQVLVPLCGKSLDLAWLAGHGFEVMGIELTQKAVEDFFSEQQLVATVTQRGPFKVYSAESIELWCGDFFALTAGDVVDCAALYDRAALIALPPEMRKSYTAHLAQILPPICQGLLITLDYDQSKIEGPPFAVPDAEVQQRLAADWRIQLLEICDVLGTSSRFLNGGVTRLEERVYYLRRGPAL
ncbi:thiopurine S-methyltransferase [Pseudomonas sp. 10B1]|uniref:thiopurine S-methyltransferase n=1 Tax=unclassified Pseudomonas TaxID=196821 RepID=UPI002AB54131|nr:MULTISPECIES: thiopurine S-methyltransferase [unclassified Pseudomonas]MDY7561346.1 thiopurine S-methyltransferase [Pseudomonas sp. AB6]MEA9996782.1 thiopurine S-methyltransferase [Pseudomonas sp. AA4]MEB0088865.1 thiopurine S-methyltransferase [Pseudomonas sp. RTI1]MEB0128248.1 thiopurine S-methyltransferase [Pseudomonas sp. CCC1.2]MEB0155199.1 thiopurine S-methyltransferase [Pseudomonas sp. CCC4.3]